MKTNKDFYIGCALAVLIFVFAIASTYEKPREPQPICCALKSD